VLVSDVMTAFPADIRLGATIGGPRHRPASVKQTCYTLEVD
jgi:hypothetical protein